MVRRGLPALLAGGAGVAAILMLAWEAGGYFPDSQLTAAAAVFAALAAAVVLRGPRRGPASAGLLAVAALIGLALWTGLSSRWSSVPDAALEDMQRVLLYVGLLGLGLVAVDSGRYARHLLWITFGAIVVIVGAGLVSRLLPDLLDAGKAVSPFDDHRLGYPLSYWNAFGALGAMGVILAIGLAADPRGHPLLRGLSAGAAVPVGVAAYLSFSRGGWLAFGLGMGVLLATAARRRQTAASLAICGTALVPAVLVLAGHPALTDDPELGAGQAAAGRAYLPVLVGLAIAAAVVQFLVARVRFRPEARETGRLLARRVLPAAGVLLLLTGAIGYAVAGDRAEGESASRLLAAERWVDRQWDEFMTPATFSGSGSERLTTARGTRSDLYRVAIDGFEARPLIGDGAGGFEVRFAYDRDVGEKVRDAHSLYLETLGELGAVGALLLLAFLGSVGWGAIAARRRAGALSRQQAATVIAALVVWAGHAGVDWDWQMPALTGAALLLAATVLPEGRSSRRIRRRRDTAP